MSRLCKDCIHHKNEWKRVSMRTEVTVHNCYRKFKTKDITDEVTGNVRKVESGTRSCDSERSWFFGLTCGPKAKYFQPKESE